MVSGDISYRLKNILKFITKLVLFPFEHLVEIFIVSFVMGFITSLELRFFSIPEKYFDRIWLSNIILSFTIYFVSKKLNKNDKINNSLDSDIKEKGI